MKSINKLQQNAKRLNNYANALKIARKAYVAVGVMRAGATAAIYGGPDVVQIAAAHEYGASFMHPGGTGYIIGKAGKAVFVKTARGGAVAGITKPHNITIPRRSFLRMPFTVKQKEIVALTDRQFSAVFEKGRDIKKALGLIGVEAQNISLDAFDSEGFGYWPKVKYRDGQTLTDTGTLKGSVMYEVRGAS